MKTRTLYDSVTVTALPADGDLYLAYIDGVNTSDNYRQVRARFPRALIVKCTVTGGTLDAQVGDIENGDMTPASGAAWAKRKLAIGQTPTLYMSSSTWPAVKAAVAAAGIAGKVCYLVASYDGAAVIPVGAIGKQYRSTTTPNLDTSIVAGHWPGVDPPLRTVSAHAAHLAHLARLRSLAVLHRLHLLHIAKGTR